MPRRSNDANHAAPGVAIHGVAIDPDAPDDAAIDGSARGDFLRAALDELVAGRAPLEPDAAGDMWQHAVASFCAAEQLDTRAARSLATTAVSMIDTSTPASVHVAAYAARAFASSGEVIAQWTDIAPGETPTGDPIVDALPLLDELGDDDASEFARYLLAEAALTSARVALADGVPRPRSEGFLLRGGRPHPFTAVFTVLSARIAAFGGRIDEAQAVLQGAVSDAPLLDLLLDATRALVDGNAASRGGPRRLHARLDEIDAGQPTRISVGCRLLTAYGHIATGDVRDAASLVLALDDGTGLSNLMVTDRAIGIELLVHAAIDEDDLDAADAWAETAAVLAGSPTANATVGRIRSRILLAHGDASGALAAADTAEREALADGRLVEAREATMLSARAAIGLRASGDADRRLQAVAAEAASAGHHAAVRSASHELRAVGRRLRPTRGTEWAGLSERERQVGRLLLAGHTNAEIAAALYVSTHTVRVHVSRVLAAFGVPSRFALAAVVTTDDGDPVGSPDASPLTARQHEVVAAVAGGARNAEIAEHLQISVKTVEKHLSDIMRRLGVTTRVGVLRHAHDPAVATAVDAAHRMQQGQVAVE